MENICEMQTTKYVIGLDYGTLSARAVLVATDSGKVVAESVCSYPHGILSEELPADFALQEIDDYVETMYCTAGGEGIRLPGGGCDRDWH